MCINVNLSVTFLNVVLVAVGGEKVQDEEPHDYTISFFQFNPNDIGAFPKKVSKKEIKPSDAALKNSTKANMKQLNVTTVTNGTVNGDKNNTHSDLEKIKDWKDITNNTKIESTNKSQMNSANKTQGQTTVRNETANINMQNKTQASGIKIQNQTQHLLGHSSSLLSNKSVSNASKTNQSNIFTASNSTSNQPHSITRSSSKRNNIVTSKQRAQQRKDNVLNPNPRPSTTEAEMKIKDPTTDIHHMADAKHFNELLFQKNVTQIQNKEQNAKLKNSQQLMKTGEEPPAKNEKVKGNKKLSKLEKDKKRNEEIQANAKKIHPVKNMVDNKSLNISTKFLKNISIALHDDIGDSTHKIPPTNKKNRVIEHHREDISIKQNDSLVIADNKKSTIFSHRVNAKKVIPTYELLQKKDQNLSFQIGSSKHPAHDIFPQCFKCGPNATYSECVKKSMLVKCNKDVKNICYTKSSKKSNVISYEMGCADHKACQKARAFPCKGMFILFHAKVCSFFFFFFNPNPSSDILWSLDILPHRSSGFY